MIAGDHFGEAAAGIAALQPDDPARRAADDHAATCGACARALREAERLRLLLAAAQPPPLPEDVLLRASAPLVADLQREQRSRRLAGAVVVAASFAILVGAARHPSRAAGDWTSAALLAAAAMGLVATASRWGRLTVGGAAGAALAAAALLGGVGPLEAGAGLHCLSTELACAAAAAGAIWLVLRRSATRPSSSAVAAVAAAGALAGDAALQLTCDARGALAHVLPFHAGGVLAAAAIAALAWWALRGRLAVAAAP